MKLDYGICQERLGGTLTRATEAKKTKIQFPFTYVITIFFAYLETLLILYKIH